MMTLQQIAELIGGTLVGDGEIGISGVETIEGARSGDLTFAVDEKLNDKLASCQASAALVSRPSSQCPSQCPIAHIQCDDVQSAFQKIAEIFRPAVARPAIGISPQAHVSPTATIAEDVNIYPGAFVGDRTKIAAGSTIHPGVCILEDCTIGENVTIFPNAVLYENTSIGDRSIVHAGAIVGAFGFGYQSSEQGHELSAQLGNVEVDADVDIGANTTIDRGTFGTTRIGAGSKLDNQVMIGHNCQIGTHNLLCSQVGIAGSTSTGTLVVLAGQVGIGDHLSIGDSAILCAQSGVMHNLEGGQTYMGSPATLAREHFQIFAAQTRLPEMRKEFRKMQRQIEKLVVNQQSGEGQSGEEKNAA